MKKIKQFIFLWGPVLVWMGIIFAFSSRPRISVSETYIVNFLIFKLLHMIEYAILFLLLARAFGKSMKNRKQAIIYALLFAVLYAISDEIHQTFIPTREGKIRDVLIDALGIAIMYVYIKRENIFRAYGQKP